MIAAYPHPSGMQHPGMAHGQPIGPGPSGNQPLGQPMQMHPGVSGPNGPHVTQAGPMMAGMQPGVGPGGPNALAHSHLTPQAQMFQQHHNMQSMQAAAIMGLWSEWYIEDYWRDAGRPNVGPCPIHLPGGWPETLEWLNCSLTKDRQTASDGPLVSWVERFGSDATADARAYFDLMLSLNFDIDRQANGLLTGVYSSLPEDYADIVFHQFLVANNPHLAQQFQRQQQHQLFLRQQQQAAQQAQNNMAMGFPNGINPRLNPQQITAMQAASNPQMQAVNLPPHIQQQLQQQQMQQQAQAQHAQQQQQQQNLAQHMAMQQAASQSSNPGQQGLPNQPGQPGPQNQMRPQPQMGGSHEVQSSPAQSAHHQQGQPQPQQSQPTPQQQQAHQQQTAQQQQQLQQQQLQQNQQLQQLNQQQAMAHRQAQAALVRQQQQAQASMRTMSGLITLKLLSFADHLSRFKVTQQPNDMGYWKRFVASFFADDGVLRQSIRDSSDGKSKQFEICNALLPRYFHIQFEGTVENIQMSFDGAVEYDLGPNGHYVEASRSRLTHWHNNGHQVVSSGKLSVHFDREDRISTLSFDVTDTQSYLPRSQIDSLFLSDSAIQRASPKMSKTVGKQRNQQRQQQEQLEPSITRKDLPPEPIISWGVTQSQMQFFEVGETLSHMQELIRYSHEHPELAPAQALASLVSTYPSTSNPNQPMQQPDSQFQQQLPLQHQQQHPQINLPLNGTNPMLLQQQQQQLPPGARTPSAPDGRPLPPHLQNLQAAAGAGMPLNMSPAMAAQLLPPTQQAMLNGSPHLDNQHLNLNAGGPGAVPGPGMGVGAGVGPGMGPGQGMNPQATPSPAQTHMAPPMMAAQLSQQGSGAGSVAASVNASPNATGKRRRASAVKVEGDEGGGGAGGGGEVNGGGAGGAGGGAAGGGAAKVKASPRVGGNKRVKGAG